MNTTQIAPSYIQVRVDASTKSEAEKVLDQLGLSMSQAIKLFLKQLSIKKAVPFPLSLSHTQDTTALSPIEENSLSASFENLNRGDYVQLTNQRQIDRYFEQI